MKKRKDYLDEMKYNDGDDDLMMDLQSDGPDYGDYGYVGD